MTPEPMRDCIATHDFRSPEDVQRALERLFAETLQAMLDSVRETVGLSQAPGRLQATPNRRNGRYPKQVTTEYDEVALAIPRDRKRSFTPVVVPPHQTTRVGLEDHVIARYARG